jgi:hypothetical protein
VGGEQRLVRGDDVGARRQREQDVGARGLDAAHQLDHDVGADDELLGIRREQLARQLGVARRVAHGDADELEAAPARSASSSPCLQQAATWEPTAPAPSRATRRRR